MAKKWFKVTEKGARAGGVHAKTGIPLVKGEQVHLVEESLVRGCDYFTDAKKPAPTPPLTVKERRGLREAAGKKRKEG
jgi:hypothetical protein